MKLYLGKVALVADGPGVMVHTAPLILALQAAEMDVTVGMTPSAALFGSAFGPAMLTGHPQAPWPLGDDALQRGSTVLLAPCSLNLFKSMAADGTLSRLNASGAALLVAPAMLPDECGDGCLEAFSAIGGSHWTVIPPMGHDESIGALGALRLASPELCVEFVRRAMTPQLLAGRRVLVTAGPTAEDADPVRYVTNRSTGRMGVSLAKLAARMGAQVTLVHGPMSWPVPAFPGIDCVPVRSASQMNDAVMSRASEQDMAILCAAVADYTPVSYSDVKIKKGSEATFGLSLKRTPDILAGIGGLARRPFLIGFAAESDHVEANAQAKLKGKNCDMLCANDITEPGSGFAVGTNRVTVFMRDGGVERLPQMSKDDVARKILELACQTLAK